LAACLHILQTKAENLTVDFFLVKHGFKLCCHGQNGLTRLTSKSYHSLVVLTAEYRAGGWEMQSHIFAVYLFKFSF
jgi:hypothetical protein